MIKETTEQVPYEKSIEYAHEVDSILFDHLHDCPDINPHDMMHIFMVAMDMRPGTVVGIDSDDGSQVGRKKIVFTLIEDVCRMLNLHHDVKEKQDGWTTVSISKDSSVAGELAVNFNNSVEEDATLEMKNEREKGLLLGIPETAVTGWIHNEKMDYKELPEEVKNSLEFRAFLDFRLSKNNWQEEFELVRERAYKIEKMAPKIFEAVISTHAEMVV